MKAWWDAARRSWRREPERSFARRELDLKLRPYLPERNGFFVEAGANDGLTFTNTLYFERYRGWRGLLVEPLPERAARCRENRPNCVVESCALVAPDFPEAEITMRFSPGAAAGDGAAAGSDGRGPGGVQEVRVPARTLNALLAKHGLTQVDLLSLKVNGGELTALRGLDLKRFQPRWIVVEAHDRPAIEAHLQPSYEAVAELTPRDVLYRRVGGR
jgi:FkbM family methyltransferase